jgi:hypothetical protein
MASSITFLTTDGASGNRVLDEFEQRTALRAERSADRRIYALEGEDHRIEIVRTLDDIDPEWSRHLAMELPA